MQAKNQEKQILKILQKEQKSFEDVQVLFEKFQHLRFFDKLVRKNMKSTVFELLQKMKCQTFEENEIIFKEGSIACNFYTILTGEVYVFIKNSKVEQNVPPSQSFKQKYQDDLYMFDQTNKTFKHQLIRIMKSGDVFGELGILNGSCRLASIVTKTKVQFGIIGTQDFKSIIKSQVFKAMDNKFKFFSNLLGKNYSNGEIQQISAYFQIMKFNQDDIVADEGKEFQGVWFVSKGEIVLKKKLKNNSFKQEEDQILFSKNYAKYQMTNQKMMYLGCNNFTGFQEILQKQLTNTFTIQIHSKKAKLYYITTNNIKKCFNDFDQFWIYFKKQSNKQIHFIKVQLKRKNQEY